ncbi:MAG: acylphosphatase [Gemmatimonadales bacterium]|nr:acylphosphatase [Gemmatimonadales bacterium]
MSAESGAGAGSATVRLLVSGRVQGVGFRWFTSRAARALGLAGFVRNLADGKVEVVVTGPAQRVDELVAAVRRGPPGAAVSNVEMRADESGHDDADHKPFAVK